MEPDFGGGALEGFLAAHKSVEIPSAFAPGDQFSGWRVTALLGRGGSGEVYRVVHATLGTEAALKVCVRDEERDDIRDAAVCDQSKLFIVSLIVDESTANIGALTLKQ